VQYGTQVSDIGTSNSSKQIGILINVLESTLNDVSSVKDCHDFETSLSISLMRAWVRIPFLAILLAYSEAVLST